MIGREVCLVLRAAGGRVDLVVSAFRDDNEGADLRITDNGDTVEIRTLRTLQVTAGTLRWHVGHAFGTSELQSMILFARGTVTATTDCVLVTPDVEAPLAVQSNHR